MNSLKADLPDHLKDNPYFAFSEDTNFVPAWDKIRPEHALPAMDYIFERMRKDIEAIATNPKVPTFKNTSEALESAFALPMYFFLTFFTAMPRTEADLKKNDDIQKEISDKFHDAFMDAFLDQRLYERFLVLTLLIDETKVPTEKEKLFGMYGATFKVCGISRPLAEQKKIREMGKKISAISRISQTNMREAEKHTFVHVTDLNQLKGVSETLLNNAESEAQRRGLEGGRCFGVGTSIYGPFMQSVSDRALRKQMWMAQSGAGSSGPYDNRKTILKLIKLQHQLAHMTGHRSPASDTLRYNMALTTTTVDRFLTKLRRASKPTAEKEMQILRDFAAQEDNITKLEPWDVEYYKEKIKKRVLGYDEEQLRPYFEMEATLQGVFRHFDKMFGLTFTESHAYPKYADDLRTYDVTNTRTGKHMGVLCMDLFEREGKPAGTAWNISALSQGLFQGSVRRPVDVVVTKILKGQEGTPTLLTHYDVQVLLHEMGHAAHNLLSLCRYQSFSGTAVDTDFVEFPSQFQENWAFEPSFLDDIACHHVTGERMSDVLKRRIGESRKFMAGSDVLSRAMKGWLDLSWHRKDPKNIRSVEKFEREVTKPFMLSGLERPLVSPRFHHIFGGGYESAFYSYQWSEVMSAQRFEKFQQRGIYNKTLCAEYKRALEVGGSRVESELFYKLGHAHPTIKPLLRSYGLLGRKFNYAAALHPAEANDNVVAAIDRPGTPQVA